MSAAIISGTSEKDFQLLVSIAEKMGLSVSIVADDAAEALTGIKSTENEENGEVAELV